MDQGGPLRGPQRRASPAGMRHLRHRPAGHPTPDHFRETRATVSYPQLRITSKLPPRLTSPGSAMPQVSRVQGTAPGKAKRGRIWIASWFAKRQPDPSTPTFRPEGWVGLGALIISVGVAVGVYYFFHAIVHPRTQSDELEVIKTALTATGFIGVVLAAVYAYRRQRISEAEAHRTDAIAFGDRYTTAVSQLGDQNAAVRLGGVYAMARLADDWSDQKQTCIDVLCAYLRMPARDDTTKDQEIEVRQSLIRCISSRLHKDKAGKQGRADWRDNSFDFTGVKFSRSIDFRWCEFRREVSFVGAEFEAGARFYETVFVEALFREAIFDGRTVFTGALFKGISTFGDCVFRVTSNVQFDSVTCRDQLYFAANRDLAEATEGDLYFEKSTFEGPVNLSHREFREYTIFDGCTFRGGLVLRNTRFKGGAGFQNSIFAQAPKGRADFGPQFDGNKSDFPQGTHFPTQAPIKLSETLGENS